MQTRAEQSAKWAWKRVSSHILLLYLPFCFIIVAPASMELQKYGVVLNLSQTITRSVLNGMHEQACSYEVDFGMEINFDPEFLHNVLLASLYERKLCTRFL